MQLKRLVLVLIALSLLFDGGGVITSVTALAAPPLRIIHVDWSNKEAEDGSTTHPFRTVSKAILAAGIGDTITIQTGDYTFKGGVFTLNKPGAINAQGGAVKIAPLPLWAIVSANNYPRYNEVYGTATHNSFWFNRNHLLDLNASGTEELLSDQFLHEHIRAIELDVHTDDGHPGVWTVYHTSEPMFSQCNPLSDCLEMLRNFHYATPQHEVINIIVELKNLWPIDTGANLRDPDHSVKMFDDIFRQVLGNTLYMPRDFLNRCPGGYTMVRCAAEVGWPTIDQLRGKFIVNVLGNYFQATNDWVRYAGERPGVVKERVGFPMRSVHGGGNPCAYCLPLSSPPADWLQNAYAASIFWQVEDQDKWDSDWFLSVEVPRFLARNGVVRASDCDCNEDAVRLAKQADRIQRGFQMVQTDHPWRMFYDVGPLGGALPVDPSRRFYRPRARSNGQPSFLETLSEPGNRLYFSADNQKKQFVYALAPIRSFHFWEATVSTTRRGNTWGRSFPRRVRDHGLGCIKAAAGLNDYVEVCRRKNSKPGDDYIQDQVIVDVIVMHDGQITALKSYPASLFNTDKVGSMIALEVDNRESESRVRVYSAGRLDDNGKPNWGQPLWDERFSFPMTMQGLAATQDVLFARVQMRENNTNLRSITLCDLNYLDVNGTATPLIVDLSYPIPPQQCTPTVRPLP